jgi:hypothetical protein
MYFHFPLPPPCPFRVASPYSLHTTIMLPSCIVNLHILISEQTHHHHPKVPLNIALNSPGTSVVPSRLGLSFLKFPYHQAGLKPSMMHDGPVRSVPLEGEVGGEGCFKFGDGLGRSCRSVGRYRFSVSHFDDFSRLRKMTRTSVSLTVSGEEGWGVLYRMWWLAS